MAIQVIPISISYLQRALCETISQFSEMGENLDADPDLSKDTKLKKLFRDTTDWMFDTSKPVAKYDKPWYHPGRFFDSQAGEDPIKTPQNDSHLERNYGMV